GVSRIIGFGSKSKPTRRQTSIYSLQAEAISWGLGGRARGASVGSWVGGAGFEDNALEVGLDNVIHDVAGERVAVGDLAAVGARDHAERQIVTLYAPVDD